MKQQLKYYNQDEIWDTNPEYYQLQMREALLNILPNDVKTILDVGCGNGFITNYISQKFNVVGLDISEEALKYLKVESKLGGIDNIPYDNNSFDLVMANDVLEHLPEEIYLKGLDELFRVASKYVVITVPFAEQLDRMNVVCDNCSTKYHISHHLREFVENDFLDLHFDSWEIKEFCYTGDITRALYDSTSSLSEDYDVFKEYTYSVCPECASAKIKKNRNTEIKKVLKYISFKEAYQNINLEHNYRSELIVVFSKKDIKYKKKQLRNNKTINKSFYEIDIANFFQKVNDFTEGFFWSRYKTNNKGLSSQFPLQSKKGDLLYIQVKDNKENIKVFIENQLYGHSVELSLIRIDYNTLIYLVPEDIESLFYGTQIEVYSDNIENILFLDYLPNQKKIQSTFWQVIPGNNGISEYRQGIYYTNFIASEVTGLLPYPNFLKNGTAKVRKSFNHNMIIRDIELYLEKNTSSKAFLSEKLNQMLNDKEEIRVLLESKNNELNQMLNDKEEVRVLLESKNNELNQMLNDKEEVRAFLEDKIGELTMKLNEKVKLIDLINKKNILVFSHMYPNEIQPNLGCFVEEQLVELSKINFVKLRVVTGQPFWINSKNPMIVFRAIKEYLRQIRTLNFVDKDGLQVLYIPYIVGNPIFRHQFHAISYSVSMFLARKLITEKFKIKLIHAHTSYLDGTAALLFSKIFKVKYLITEHTGPFSFLTKSRVIKYFTKKANLGASKVIAVSNALKNDMLKELKVENDDKYQVLGNGYSSCIFFNNKEINKQDETKLLSIISLDDNKNPFLLLDVFKKLINDDGLNVSLTIVGKGILKKEVENWIHTNKLSSKIFLHSDLNRVEIADIIRDNCDIFVHPSRTETFGMVVLEALACGKPVISTRCGGPEDIIKDGINGYLCNNDDIEDMRDKIKELVIHQNIDSRGVMESVKEYEYSNISLDLLKIYEGLE